MKQEQSTEQYGKNRAEPKHFLFLPLLFLVESRCIASMTSKDPKPSQQQPLSLASFDLFVKARTAPIKPTHNAAQVNPSFRRRTTQGGLVSMIVSTLLCWMFMADYAEFKAIQLDYEFLVNHQIERQLPLHLDVNVALACHGNS